MIFYGRNFNSVDRGYTTMNVLVAVDARLYRTPDEKVWCKTIYGYDFWTRYLAVFDDITVISRLDNANNDMVKGWLRSDGPHVRFVSMPMIRGQKGYITHFASFFISKASIFFICFRIF